MSSRVSPRQTVLFHLVALIVAILLLTSRARGGASGDDPGTVGLILRQLYDDQKPDHRGPLAVMHVVEDSPAAKAGIHCSDFIVAVNGVAVPGRAFSDLLQRDFRGPVGGKIRLTVVRFDGSQSEITLVRVPYPPHSSLASDPFTYRVPGTWATDPRYPFPLPWAPALAYKGFEDVFFSPNFDDQSSPEYHSILFFMWLEGTQMQNPEQVQSAILMYFRGLAEERGRNYGFMPDLSKVSTSYSEDSRTPLTLGGELARAFSGSVTIWDTHGKTITLNSEVLTSACGTSDHTAVFFGMSMELRDGNMWKEIDAIRDSFRCKR